MTGGAEKAPLEPGWLIAANVVRWRRYGEGGQELRPGTKSYRGGSKVHVIGSYAGTGHETLTTIGRGRHTGRYITIDMATRNLHTFRAAPVYSPDGAAALRGGGSGRLLGLPGGRRGARRPARTSGGRVPRRPGGTARPIPSPAAATTA